MARILVGVSGGIAAYKAVELVRLLGKRGHAIRIIQTEASIRFVGRATFEGITGAPVLVSEFEPDPARGGFPGEEPPAHVPISHLELARRCDAYVIAPATANTIAKLATGLADNLLTSAALASSAPVVIAPAMNDRMYEHPATRTNLARLGERGVRLVPPETGELASRGEWGIGRLADPSVIAAAVEETLLAPVPRPLDGLRVVVTAGGTREPIDAVRFVGNRSSGRMGFALAEEATRRGAEVTVVAANVALERTENVRYVDVATAAELATETKEAFHSADVLLMAAAVADFRPANPVAGKLSKAGRERLGLELEPTEDVLTSIGTERRPGQLVVGFAAEHGEDAVDRARAKLPSKGLDAVVVNDVSQPDIGFDADQNEVTIVTALEEISVPRASKRQVASAIVDAVERLRVAATPEGAAQR